MVANVQQRRLERRARRRNQVEEVVENDDVEEDEVQEVIPEPSSERRRGRRERVVVKGNPEQLPPPVVDLQEEVDEEVEDIKNVQLSDTPFLASLVIGHTYVITPLSDGTFTLVDYGVDWKPPKAVKGHQLTGKAYLQEVLNPDYVAWQEEWGNLSAEEKILKAKKLKLSWEPHSDGKINVMRITQAMQVHLGIEKYKPQYQSQAARNAVRGIE